jgi:hypothetical protein
MLYYHRISSWSYFILYNYPYKLLFVQNKTKRYKKLVSLTQLLGALTAAQLIIPHLPTRLKSKTKTTIKLRIFKRF